MNATAVIVAYGVERLDLSWIAPDADVIVVHNDDRLGEEACRHDRVRHLHPGTNLGFGAGVNAALPLVTTDRVVLCNPDTRLTADHWAGLSTGAENDLVSLPLVDDEGIPNSVVNGYWSPLAFIATAWRLGRFVPRGGRLRPLVGRLLGNWGRMHREPAAAIGRWPLTERWASGAVLSLPTAAIRAVDGFDEGYFLYFEDADLQQRMAAGDPTLHLRMLRGRPGIHSVGGSSGAGDHEVVRRERRRSAARYAAGQRGRGWSTVARTVARGVARSGQ